MLNEHLVVLAQLDAEVLETEPLRSRLAPEGHEQLGRRHLRAVVERHRR